MSKFRKILPYLIIVILSLSIIVAAWFVVPMFFKTETPEVDNGDSDFIDSIGGVSETYVGAVSKYTYPSADNAARAFVENEVVGNAYAYNISTTPVASFGIDNVDINIPSELLDGADTIEKINVTYSMSSASSYSTMSTSTSDGEGQYTAVVYVIKYGPDFKYFVPMPVTGETISKSYYDSVFDDSKWANCTMELNTSMSMDVSAEYMGETMSINMDITMHQIIKYDDGKIYLFQESTQKTSGYGVGNSDEHTTIYACITEDEYGNPICYYKENENDEWQRGYLWNIGFSKVEELQPFYNDYLDYTYFSKTSYGFALEEENARQYFLQAFDQLSGGSLPVDFGNDGINMSVKYYVRDGVLSGMQNNSTVEADYSEDGVGGHLNVSVNQVVTCKDYGTTEVEMPEIHNH